MVLRSKIGQTEDIFADFIPALILLIVGIILLTRANLNHKVTLTEEIQNNNHKLDRLLFTVLMRSPVEDNGDFIHFINNLEDADEKYITELVENGWIELKYRKKENDTDTKNLYSYKCGPELYWFINSKLISTFFKWDIIFTKAENNEVIFYCSNSMYELKEGKLVPKMKIKDAYSIEEYGTLSSEAEGTERNIEYSLVYDTFVHNSLRTLNIWVPTNNSKQERRFDINYDKL